MSGRRGNGEGSIVKRNDGRYMGAVTVGTDPRTGKPKRKYIYGQKRKEVARKMTDLKQKLFNGTYSEPCNMLFKDWLKQWIKGKKHSVTNNTYKFYKGMIKNHIVPIVGDIKLKDLKTYHLQTLLNNKYENGRKRGKGGLSETTIGHIYRTLHVGLEQAVIEELIPKNPCKGLNLPKDNEDIEDEELHTWNKKQVDVFLKKAKKFRYYILHYLALNTGMRQGELLGLQWKDINFKDNTLKVKRQYARSFKFKQLKSKNSKRVIPITKQTVKELKKHKILQSEKKLALGEEFMDNDLVCCSKIGKPVSHRQIYKDFKDIIREAGLPEITFHDMRHTFSTLYLQNGGDITVLQQILGHSSITITIDTYSHVTHEMLKQASKTMESMYITANK